MSKGIQVVDIFAGPGGLGEGFASLGKDRFRINLSAEMDSNAHQTLLLRSLYRNLTPREREGIYYPFVSQSPNQFDSRIIPAKGPIQRAWKKAQEESRRLTLGCENDDQVVNGACDTALQSGKPWVLIGGPPCQAYSQVGRVRNRAIQGYEAERDHRFFLFKHYLRLVSDYGPAIFVMENVAGILSAKVNGGKVIDQILSDIDEIRFNGHSYQLFAMSPQNGDLVQSPKDFMIKSEQHGVGQTRHRMIILGVREDVLRDKLPGKLKIEEDVSAQTATAGLPAVRSTLSGKGAGGKSTGDWAAVVTHQFEKAVKACKKSGPEYSPVAETLNHAIDKVTKTQLGSNGSEIPVDHSEMAEMAKNMGMEPELSKWLLCPSLTNVLNHDTRGHMDSDLGRYGFSAAYGKAFSRAPTSRDFPAELAPAHKNWKSGDWADRFRVVVSGEPCRTITKHISKDGHAFIHWDPAQCRSLTVREAARIQTFPDDYYFLGGRTSAYGQVGNAVPPFLARKIARIVEKLLT